MGFIGSHLCERLVQVGATVRAMGRYNSQGHLGHLQNSPFRNEMELRLGDVRDPNFVDSAMDEIEVVFHLAALIGIPYSYSSPHSYVSTNVVGTLNVLNAVRRLGVQRMIHTSTSEVYGTALEVPIKETHPLQGQSPYSATKIGADKLVESFFLSFETPVVTARPFNTFGPRQSRRAVIPTIISQALAGAEISLGSLSPTRDFNYVDNTVDGFLACAVSDNALGRTFNLGYGKEISIGDLVKLILDLVGSKAQVRCVSERTRPAGSEVNRLLACNSLARSVLGWEPTVGLREGIERTIEWMKTQDLDRATEYAV